MQLIDTKCPMCMGNVVRIPGTNTGECESCGSRFTLPEAAAAGGSGDDGEGSKRRGENFDLAEFFAKFLRKQYDASEHNDITPGEKLGLRESNVRKHFDISKDAEIYLVLDTTIMHSGKVGFACCDDGWYCKDEDGDVCYYTWEDFSDLRLETDGGTIEVGGSPFYTTSDEADILFDMLDDLQGYYE